MNIEDLTRKDAIPLSEVKIGECFKYNKQIYMKMNNFEVETKVIKIPVVNLRTGEIILWSFLDDLNVMPVRTETKVF